MAAAVAAVAISIAVGLPSQVEPFDVATVDSAERAAFRPIVRPVEVVKAPEPSSPPAPRPPRPRGPVRVRGVATFYDYHRGQAAAGPLLKRALGGGNRWRGRVVWVCRESECIRVRLTDSCACGPRPKGPTVIDLDRRDFSRLAPTSRGVIEVVIRW